MTKNQIEIVHAVVTLLKLKSPQEKINVAPIFNNPNNN